MATWRELIGKELHRNNESWSDVISNTLSENQLDVEFNDDYGSEQGEEFTVWSINRVYFPVCYDGSEWVDSVSRNPDGIPTPHVGG